MTQRTADAAPMTLVLDLNSNVELCTQVDQIHETLIHCCFNVGPFAYIVSQP